MNSISQFDQYSFAKENHSFPVGFITTQAERFRSALVDSRFRISTSDLRESLVGRHHAENFENLHSSTCISSGADGKGTRREREKEKGRGRKRGREKENCLRTAISNE